MTRCPVPPPRWRAESFVFKTLAEARAALGDRALLARFWEEAAGVLARLRVTEVGRELGTELISEKLKGKTLCVHALGESGAGKSSLLAAIVADAEKEFTSSASLVGTVSEACVRMTSGVCFIDTPGFRLPVEHTGSWAPVTWMRSAAAWRRTLASIRKRVLEGALRDPDSADALPGEGERPDVVLYCHKAGTRIVPERMLEVLTIPHLRAQVPTVLVLTDVCSVTDSELEEIRKCIRTVLEELGPNACDRRVQLVEVNSSDKTVRGHRFKVTGLTDLIGTVLNAVEPADVLRLARRRSWFARDAVPVEEAEAGPRRKRPRVQCKVEGS